MTVVAGLAWVRSSPLQAAIANGIFFDNQIADLNAERGLVNPAQAVEAIVANGFENLAVRKIHGPLNLDGSPGLRERAETRHPVATRRLCQPLAARVLSASALPAPVANCECP